VQHLDYEDYLEHCETYKSQKEHLKKQKNHLSRYVQELKDVREEHKILNDKENSLKHRWLNFTHTFTREAFGKPYQIVSLSLGSRYFIATCCHKLKGSTSRQLENTLNTLNRYRKGENKFKGGDLVIKKIIY
jgi:hypothetical protein